MKLVDTFLFYNETKLLEYRLNLLKDIVDHFIVVESTHTFKGQPKKLFFDKSFLKNYNIVHIVVEDLPFLNNPNNNEVWKNEKHQRNCIIRGLEKIKLEGPDYFIISDVDEIPDPKTLLEIKKNNTITIGQLEQDLYYYNMNNRKNLLWYYPKILRYSYFCSINLDIHSIRLCLDYEKIKKGGWHLSYFGDPEFISNKIKNFSHQEFNLPDFTDIGKITTRIQNKQDIFDRAEPILPPNKDYLPPNFDITFNDI